VLLGSAQAALLRRDLSELGTLLRHRPSAAAVVCPKSRASPLHLAVAT
jgi:hypothetical protein